MARLKLALCVILAAASWPVWAENWEAEEPQERCALCHGYFGDGPRPKFPKLAAQRPEYLEAQVRAFLAGTRHNDGGQMVQIVTEITEDEIPVAINWFASQDPPTPTQPDDPSLADQGAGVWADRGCGTCHAPQEAATTNAPLLTAQHPAYLAKQIRDFQAGRRDWIGGDKQALLAPLSETDIVALSAWLGATPRAPK